jgi:hypothetical protein
MIGDQMGKVAHLETERRQRARLEIARLQLLERLRVLDQADVDRRIVELQDAIAELERRGDAK